MDKSILGVGGRLEFILPTNSGSEKTLKIIKQHVGLA
jgi:hypothetical protein